MEWNFSSKFEIDKLLKNGHKDPRKKDETLADFRF